VKHSLEIHCQDVTPGLERQHGQKSVLMRAGIVTSTSNRWSRETISATARFQDAGAQTSSWTIRQHAALAAATFSARFYLCGRPAKLHYWEIQPGRIEL